MKKTLVKFKHWLEFQKFKGKNEFFNFNEKRFKKFYHVYNATWTSERKYEIPIFQDMLEQYKNQKVLEVGNVLSHYFNISHTIVDKYETSHGVINEDAVDFDNGDRFDLIISISTLEHIGVDENEPSDKSIRAINHLLTLLNAHGKLVFSFLIGYNSSLDNFINQNLSDEYSKKVKLLDFKSEGLHKSPNKKVAFIEITKD